MGIFSQIRQKKEEEKNKRAEEEQNRIKAEQQKINEEAEAKRILELEQAKNREAYTALCAGDDERFQKGALWMLKNEKPILIAPITKIGKETKDNSYYTPCDMEVGNTVEFDDSFDWDENGNDKSKIIVSFNSSEIGELSKATKQKLEDYDIDNLVGIISKVNDDDEFKASVSIFNGSDFSEPGYRQLHTYIAGTKFDNDDGSSRQNLLSHCFKGERLRLKVCDYNGDPSVMVCTARDLQLGFLKSDIAKEFSEKIQNNQIGGIYISKISDKEGTKYCDIIINIANYA